MTVSRQCVQLKELIQSQTKDSLYDDNWSYAFYVLTECWPPLLGTSEFQLLPSTFGRIVEDTFEGKPAIKWYRPDTGMALLNWNEDWAAESKIAGFILNACLIGALRDCGYESFVKKGVPKHWNRCSVFLGDKQVEHVIWADAILGLCERGKVANGSVVVSKGEIVTETIRGNITIRVNKESQTIF